MHSRVIEGIALTTGSRGMEKDAMVVIMFHFLHFLAGDNIRHNKLSKDYTFDALDGGQENEMQS